MDNGTVIVISLTVGGIILLLAEVLLPGMIAGIMGVLFLMAATVVMFMKFGAVPGSLFAICLIVGGGTLGMLWLKYFDKTPFGKDLVMQQPKPAETPYKADTALVGKKGRSLTLLRPVGTAEIEGRRLDVVAESRLIPANTPVEVVSVVDNVITVRAVPA